MFNLLVQFQAWADGRGTMLASRALEWTEQSLVESHSLRGTQVGRQADWLSAISRSNSNTARLGYFPPLSFPSAHAAHTVMLSRFFTSQYAPSLSGR